MIIGCPKEIKEQEFRVGMTPGSVAEVVKNGHSVLIETGAGLGSGFGFVKLPKTFGVNQI